MVGLRAGHRSVRSRGWARVLAPLLAMVLVTAGAAVVVTTNAVSVEPGVLVGTVLLPDGTPAGGITVELLDASQWNRPVKHTATTAPDGTYEVSAAPGAYLVRFVDPAGAHLWTFDGGRADAPDDLFSAPGTAIEAGGTVSVDHTLIRSGSVRGRITLQADVDPTEVSVVAFSRPPTGMNQPVPDQWGRVAADGTFVIPLMPRTYRISFSHRDDLIFSMDESATVTGTAVTTLNVTPQRSGSISGVVRVPSGSDEQTVRVSVLTLQTNGSWQWGRSILAEAGRPYQLAGLRTGTYRVEFAAEPGASPSRLAPSFWPGVPSVEQASEVAVVVGEDRPGVNGELVVGGEVTGRVDPALGITLSTTVELWRKVEGGFGPASWQGLGTSYQVGADGSFRITGLPAGRYRLQAEGLQGADWEVFYPGVRAVEAATDFDVALGGTTTGIDVRVPRVQPTPTPTPVPEPILKTLERLKAPKVTGTAKVGRTLRVSRGSWKPKSVTVKYRWYVKKGKKAVKVKAATKPKLKLKKSTRGKRYRVVVTVSKKGYKTVRFTSKWSKKVKR